MLKNNSTEKQKIYLCMTSFTSLGKLNRTHINMFTVRLATISPQNCISV